MRVPIDWLRDYVDFDLSPRDLADKLTMAGLAVEAIVDLAAPFKSIVVGRILSLAPHSALEGLILAQTDWGRGPRLLVTGATNLRPGDLVPVAPAGVSLPDGRAIEAAVFAGLVSEGLLCSAAELGLEKESDGILVLEGDWAPGTSAAAALGFDEFVLEIELTPNRADCLGMLGVAREVAAISGGQVHLPPGRPRAEGQGLEALARVEVLDPDLCPRYGGKVFLDVGIAPSPAWMQRRLRAAGVRPIDNVVDITNYVMLESNQPLHAFDLDRLSAQRVIVRRVRSGESLRTLDEAERALPEGALVIADAEGPVAVAGIMGGVRSEVTGETARVFLESACFERTSIRRTAKTLAMRTEASLRFERGVDPAGVLTALERAAYLVAEIGAGRVARGTIDVAARAWEPRRIEAAPSRINALLGTILSPREIGAYLSRFGFEVAPVRDDVLSIVVPTYRQDVEGTADLAEEVARLHGYDRIPPTYPASAQVGRRTAGQEFAAHARRLLLGLGQTEIVTYSFCCTRLLDQLLFPPDDPRRRNLAILAPLSEEWSLMRPTLLGGVLEALSTNARRGVGDACLFEQARVYRPHPERELPDEPLFLTGGLVGYTRRRFWAEKPRTLDFYDLKGLIEALLCGLGITGVSMVAGRHPSLHPGRTACLLSRAGARLGHLGEAHPRVAAAFDLRGPVYLYELDFELLGTVRRPLAEAKAPPRFPAVSRDLAVVIPEDTALARLEETMRRIGGEFLSELDLFDVYTGPQVGSGLKSMAFALTFRAPDRTLTDAEVGAVMERIVAGLEKETGAVQRRA